MGDPFELESNGSLSASFLRRGVNGSFRGTRTRMFTMSAMIVSEELNAQCFKVK